MSALRPSPQQGGFNPGKLRVIKILDRQPRLHPALLPFWIMRDLRVAHRHEFTGSVCTGVSMTVGAVCDNFSILVGQRLWGEFLDAFGRDVQGSGNVGFLVSLRRECFDHGDFLSVEFGFEIVCGICNVHPNSPSLAQFSMLPEVRRFLRTFKSSEVEV
jgi:hypothetical protein